MTLDLIHSVFVLSCLLGLLAWVVPSPWQLLSPNPPLLAMYPIWITGCALYAWAAWTRKSFGMLANYLLLTSIDTVGLIRML